MVPATPAGAEPASNPIVALWAVPRSVSTAFERMMRARGDLAVFHEPFLPYYYYGEDRVVDHYNEGIEPDPSHDYARILEGILARADAEPVFFKDMAYYLRRCMSRELVGLFTNTFLIRHPRRTLPSLYRLFPDSTLEEAGFDQQYRLMRVVHEMTGELTVVDAEELRRSPGEVVASYCRAVGLEFIPQALEWEPVRPDQEPEEWKPWERWHADAISSTGFEPPMEEEDEPLPPEVPADVYEHCAEVYGRIVALREKAAAQR
jgi:hypothetical protein